MVADDALLRDALAGDPRRTRELVLALLPTVKARVLHALRRYGRGAAADEVVDDFTQQVFLALFEDDGKRLRAWEPGRGASLATFVGLLAEREVIGALRRGRRNPWTESPTEDDELARCLGGGADLEGEIASRELLNVVLDRALPAFDARGLVLFQRLVVDDVAVDVVAGETGATLGALYMWKSRFAKLVREIVSDLSFDRTPRPPRARRPVPARGDTPVGLRHASRGR